METCPNHDDMSCARWTIVKGGGKGCDLIMDDRLSPNTPTVNYS